MTGPAEPLPLLMMIFGEKFARVNKAHQFINISGFVGVLGDVAFYFE